MLEFALILCYLSFKGVDLKKASKAFSQKFSCGSSVTGEDEVVVQGEVGDELVDYIQQLWPEVSGCLFCSVVYAGMYMLLHMHSFLCIYVGVMKRM